MPPAGLRCRHAFEYAVVHGNGEVVCSIIDGRGDFVLGNVHQQSLSEIFDGPQARALRQLVLSTSDSTCPAIGKACPLKTILHDGVDVPPPRLRFLAIETTTACDLRCLSCPVRDFTGDTTWRDAWRDGGWSFLIWDGARRTKQHAADLVRRTVPAMVNRAPGDRGRLGSLLLRGRVARSRTGTLPLETVKRIIDEAGDGLERVDMFNYGEPFLYRHLTEALRHIRRRMPTTQIAISTDGMQVREPSCRPSSMSGSSTGSLSPSTGAMTTAIGDTASGADSTWRSGISCAFIVEPRAPASGSPGSTSSFAGTTRMPSCGGLSRWPSTTA